MLSVIYGQAIEVEPYHPEDPRVRLYRVKDAIEGSSVAVQRTFMGTHTDDIVHVCDRNCLASLLERDFGVGTTGPVVTRCSEPGDSYIDLEGCEYTDGRKTGQYLTIDVQEFDPGDDPYVLCAVCERELVRDDEAFEAQYGRRIGE